MSREILPTLDFTLAYDGDIVDSYIVNNVEVKTNEDYLASEGPYIGYTGMIIDGKFRFPMMKQTRFNLEFTEDYVLLKLDPEGFFTTAYGYVNLHILEPYYVISSATYVIAQSSIKLNLKIKKGYTYDMVAEIFRTLTSPEIPEVEKGGVDLHIIPDSTAYITTVVDKKDQRFIYARKAKRAELKNYASIKDITRSKHPFYFNDHVLTGKTTHTFIRHIATVLFGGEDFQVYGEVKNGGYLVVARESCDFCDDEHSSEHDHTHISEVCESCYEHIEAISALLKMLGDTKSPELQKKVADFKKRLEKVNKKATKKSNKTETE